MAEIGIKIRNRMNSLARVPIVLVYFQYAHATASKSEAQSSCAGAPMT